MFPTLFLERENWFLWIPVFFGIGIVVFFYLSFEPNINLVLSMYFAVIILSLIFFLLFNNDYEIIKIILWVILIASSGFTTICIKANNLKTNILPYEKKFFTVKAVIESNFVA